MKARVEISYTLGDYKYIGWMDISEEQASGLMEHVAATKDDFVICSDTGIDLFEMYKCLQVPEERRIHDPYIMIHQVEVYREKATRPAKEKTEDQEMIDRSVEINRVMLGSYIKAYLQENKITITQLAAAAGVSREQVGWLITGKRDPRLSTMLRVMAAMKHSILLEKEE